MRSTKAVVLDIDGVLLKGNQLISGANRAVRRLQIANIPFCFVTNGGGLLEAAKAKELRSKLNIDISDSQVIVCHTPFRQLANVYKHKKVVVVGREACLSVASSYGLNRTVGAQELSNTIPYLLPTRKSSCSSSLSANNIHKKLSEMSACFVFHDPVDWSLEMQLLNDILVEYDGNIAKQRIPLFACNADLVYATEHPLPRFTQGAFVEAFRHIFQLTHGIPLEVTYFGKPFKVQYDYAETVIKEQAANLNQQPPQIFFGIGDNPKSDIRGANNAGEHWRSVLVRTGLFSGPQANDTDDPADFVFANALEAVDYIIDQYENDIKNKA